MIGDRGVCTVQLGLSCLMISLRSGSSVVYSGVLFKTIVEMFHDLLATAAGMNSEINLQRCH